MPFFPNLNNNAWMVHVDDDIIIIEYTIKSTAIKTKSCWNISRDFISSKFFFFKSEKFQKKIVEKCGRPGNHMIMRHVCLTGSFSDDLEV